jgi:GNAT superfamily N-acetyltransferase
LSSDGRTRTTHLRVARHTERLAEVVAFYRDGIGLREAGGFRDHAGYDGAFLEVPETGAHLEFTAGGPHGGPVAHPESLLVLYLGDEDTVRTVAGRLGAEPVAPANPFWAEHALTFEDPDGFRVVLVPEPWIPDGDAHGPAIRVELHTGPRGALRPLFELAEDSAPALDAYIDAGRVLVAVEGERVVGQLQLTDSDHPSAAEIKNMAVAPSHQGRGVGRALVEAAIARAADPRVIELDRNMPWRELVTTRAPEALYVMYPKSDGWGAQAVPEEVGAFGNRRDLPAEWAGHSGEELAAVTGVPDAIFAHPARFYVSAASREGIVALIEQALAD